MKTNNTPKFDEMVRHRKRSERARKRAVALSVKDSTWAGRPPFPRRTAHAIRPLTSFFDKRTAERFILAEKYRS